MTPIEDLVREALASMPEPVPSTHPLGSLEGRVRRARRRLAAGAGVVAAVIAAAIVIPLTVGGGGARSSVQVVTPQPSVTPSPPPPGTTALWTRDAIWASTSPSGQRWLLYSQYGQDYLTRVSGKKEKPIVVGESPADYIVATDKVVWVIGTSSGNGAGARSYLTAVLTSTGAAIPMQEPQLSYAAAVGGSLYAVETDPKNGDVFVDRFDADNSGAGMTWSKPVGNAQEIVATLQQRLWIHEKTHLTELIPRPGGFEFGPQVPWGSGPLLAPALTRSGGPGAVWAYDGSRLIALMPSALSGCVSCAEGARVTVPGKPSSVVEEKDGLYVAVPGAGLYYYSPDSLGSGETPVSASIKGVQVTSVSADPAGGVDYVDDQGNLIHWQPAAR